MTCSKLSIFMVALSLGIVTTAFSEETFPEKVGDKVDEVKTDVKIDARNAKRKARKAACTDARRAAGKCGVGMDMKDSAENAGDEIKHGAKKLKNKVD